MAQLTQNPPEGLQVQVIWCIEWIRQLRGRLGINEGGGGSISLPNTQIGYGTGSGVSSSDNFTYGSSKGEFNILDPVTGEAALLINPAGQTWKIGAINFGNGTNIAIDDINQDVIISSNIGSSSAVFFLGAIQSGTNPIIVLGDVNNLGSSTQVIIDDLSQLIKITNVQQYADDTTAIGAGLVTGQVYKTTTTGSTFLKIVP